ncbi:MAG: prolyl oligopeptidase family serine peptidase [Terracidiphilus sp.]
MTNALRLMSVLLVLFVSKCCRGLENPTSAIPKIDVTDQNGMLAISTWRICGPFFLSKSQDYTWYSLPHESEALNHDYLKEIGGQESPLTLGPGSTNININFNNDVKNQSKGDDPPPLSYKPFVDQVQEFPTADVSSQILYWQFPKRFSITYASVLLSTRHAKHLVLIASSNSPLKIWLNEEAIAEPAPGSVGHNWSDYYILRIHLRAGNNPLLVKMLSFPERNDFSLHIATSALAKRFIQNNVTDIDLLDNIIVPKNASLHLSQKLEYLATPVSSSANVSILSSNGTVMRSNKIDLKRTRELSIAGIPDGVYDLHLSKGQQKFSETFYIGNVDELLAHYKLICSDYKEKNDVFNPCVVLQPLLDRMSDSQMIERLDKEKTLLLLLSQLVWSEQGHTADSPSQDWERHIFLQSYRSGIDAKQQYYYIHLPPGYSRKTSVPLVIICPYNHHRKPFLVGPTNTLTMVLQEYAYFADKYGFAFIVPYARGVGMSNPLGMKDVSEAIEDVQRRYRIDARRLYLAGDCAGGRGAFLLAEHHPQLFAAISTVDASTGAQFVEYSEDDTDDDTDAIDDGLLSSINKLSHTSIRLIHGDLDPHSPIRQAFSFKERCIRNGFKPELIILPGDGTMGERDPVQLSFEFFKDKRSVLFQP